MNHLTLPEGYAESFTLDLQKDKKTALLVNGLAVLITIPLAVLGCYLTPISALFSFEEGMLSYFARFLTLLLGMVVYMVLHELVHGIFMKHYLPGIKIHYGFTGLYAFAGCDGYFDKRSYLTIALAPVVLLGLVLLALNLFASETWFWVIYFIQICNLSGAAGDFYVTWKFSRLPADILVRDPGTSMAVYTRG